MAPGGRLYKPRQPTLLRNYLREKDKQCERLVMNLGGDRSYDLSFDRYNERAYTDCDVRKGASGRTQGDPRPQTRIRRYRLNLVP